MTGWTLRRRLVVVLVSLLIGVAATIGTLSTLALRESLVDQLDERLDQASIRALGAHEGPRVDAQNDATAAGEPAARTGGTRALDVPPPGLDTPGQGAGTVTLSIRNNIELSGYIDAVGSYQSLTDEQIVVLEEVEPDGRPRTVSLDDLGPYRVVAERTADGTLVVTGLSSQDVTATVSQYLAVEVIIAALGILTAALAGGALVRRELRPLERVVATATRVSQVPLHRGEVAELERVPDADTDPGTEVGKVGSAVNRLLDHVEGALAARHESETQVRQFVADASHELRTPLASIRGYAELVRRMPDEVPDDVLHAMERVESESLRMTTLVEDMLLLARLDAGRPLGSEEVDLTALALDAVSDAHAAGPDHRWRLDLPETEESDDDIDDPSPTIVLGDEGRLRQVLVNLLANARVHTPVGTTIVTSVRSDGETVVLTVRDDGPGIPESLRNHLFQRFSRGNAARSPGSGSTGLGLAIVDAVVRAHRGRIDVDGTPGATTFTVTLPVAGVTAETAAPAGGAPAA
ncbi:sensor histidine kinase [Sanguibacter antarcticus]|uniref:histidine kinase n=1 Tax=Sanguibacter antarcticus TaxID=372484 RepID=A0A2A9E9G1_9MICO|nr:HAMP domain-containing sensor histidine kinase [Sanguibacter antarcticus]PFG35171.1 two-component system OmpR family sensor kinase [Sanguibacter antarcticus]